MKVKNFVGIILIVLGIIFFILSFLWLRTGQEFGHPYTDYAANSVLLGLILFIVGLFFLILKYEKGEIKIAR